MRVTFGFLAGLLRATRLELLGAISDLRIAPRSEYRAVVRESQQRKGYARLLAVVMLGDAIRRFLGELRPADWAIIVIELGFAGMIAIQWIIESRHKRHLARKRRDVYALLAKGHALVKSTPIPSFMADEKDGFAGVEWTEAVNAWITETRQFLESLSDKAASSFMLISSSSGKDTRLYTPAGSFPIDEKQKECYQILLSHLGNLKEIMENTETYF